MAESREQVEEALIAEEIQRADRAREAIEKQVFFAPLDEQGRLGNWINQRVAEARRFQREVETQLAEVYTPEGIDLWLRGRHKLLNQERPIDLITRGEGQQVLAVATQLAESAYA